MPFVVLVGGLLLAGLIALLMLHTLAAQDAFRQTSLQQRLATLTDTEQHLEQQVQLDSSPITLRQRATALGMVPSVVTSYHRLPDGRVVAHEVASTAVVPATAPTSAAAKAKTGTTAASSATKTSTAAPSTASSTSSTSSTTSTTTKAPKHHHRGVQGR
jgi:hypothetical protein